MSPKSVVSLVGELFRPRESVEEGAKEAVVDAADSLGSIPSTIRSGVCEGFLGGVSLFCPFLPLEETLSKDLRESSMVDASVEVVVVVVVVDISSRSATLPPMRCL